jgi:pullulanase/glycogen debranching enzyme
MDSLRYWVTEMHVDGFRFDLAATLARGAPTVDTWSAFFSAIHQDPVLQRVKLIAEPWDTGSNGYQAGNFPFHWSEWNDKYRETVRRFWRDEPSALSDLATRLTGSADLFRRHGRGPSASINHDNAYDQDNAISWLNWSRVDDALQRFTRRLIQLRKEVPWLEHGDWSGGDLQVEWRGPDGQPLSEDEWQAPRAHLALLGRLDRHEGLLILNATDETVRYTLPNHSGVAWHVAVDTTDADISMSQTPVETPLAVRPRALVLLARRPPEGVS